jgi:hypothetical protein
MGCGVWGMGANSLQTLGKSKYLWVIGECGVYGLWVTRETVDNHSPGKTIAEE